MNHLELYIVCTAGWCRGGVGRWVGELLYRSFGPKGTSNVGEPESLHQFCYRTVRIAHVWGVNFSLIFICAQSVPEFLWERLRATIQFPVIPKRAQYARFGGEHPGFHEVCPVASRGPRDREIGR